MKLQVANPSKIHKSSSTAFYCFRVFFFSQTAAVQLIDLLYLCICNQNAIEASVAVGIG